MILRHWLCRYLHHRLRFTDHWIYCYTCGRRVK
jgi:hypothetical protein